MKKLQLTLLIFVFCFSLQAAEDPFVAGGKSFVGSEVSSSVEQIFEAGLQHLAGKQGPNGNWTGNNDAAITALACLCFLARGEDPNYGPYAQNIRKGLKFVLSQQDQSGYIGRNMYAHGFCTMALAECYGVVNIDGLGIAVQRAVTFLLKAQKNNKLGGWRYSPGDTETSDTSINGACLVGLFAARNAGVNVPQESIDRCLSFYKSRQDEKGNIGYSSRGGGSPATTAIGALLYFYAKKFDSETARKSLGRTIENVAHKTKGWHGSDNGYSDYYVAQALFQGDMKAWRLWNDEQISKMKKLRYERGWKESGDNLKSSFFLLSLALNYRYLPIYER